MKRKKETEKLDPAFERCQHCGEVYFKTDGKATKSGFVCVLCVNRGYFPHSAFKRRIWSNYEKTTKDLQRLQFV